MAATAVDDVFDKNKELADFLELVAGYHTMAGEKYKASAFSKAAAQIRDYPTAIISGAQARRDLRGIGASTETEIDEFLVHGTSNRLRELETRFADRKEIIDYFRSFYGIGPVKAIDYYNQGFRTLEDLWTRAPLVDSSRMAIMWREHLSLRIEREEMDRIHTRLGTILNPYGLRWNLAGSYRRGEASSGDIDILI